MVSKKCSRCGKVKDLSKFPLQDTAAKKYMSACKECINTWRRDKRRDNKEEFNKKDRERYLKEQGRRVKYAREYRSKYPDRTRNTNLKTKYGIDMDTYAKMKNDQESKCLICGRHEEDLKRILCVDHCHKTNKIRGLLCDTCNKFLGFYEKHRDGVIKYLGENRR